MRAYTWNGAYASFEEDIKGRIKAGMLADFAVLEQDPRDVDPSTLADLGVTTTIIGGEIVYER